MVILSHSISNSSKIQIWLLLIKALSFCSGNETSIKFLRKLSLQTVQPCYEDEQVTCFVTLTEQPILRTRETENYILHFFINIFNSYFISLWVSQTDSLSSPSSQCNSL